MMWADMSLSILRNIGRNLGWIGMAAIVVFVLLELWKAVALWYVAGPEASWEQLVGDGGKAAILLVLLVIVSLVLLACKGLTGSFSDRRDPTEHKRSSTQTL